MKKKHPYGIIDPCLQIDIADSILDEFFQITRQLKIRACLTHGLCLGFIRDGGYIEGDNDLDIGIICNNEEQVNMMVLLEKHGFIRGGTGRKGNMHFHKNNVLLDIYPVKSNGFYSQFDNVQYKGKAYSIPHPIEEYLKTMYGDWRIKK